MPRRLKRHQTVCNKILKLADERLSGNRRALIELIALWLDCDGQDKELIASILRAEYGTPRRIRINDPEDPVSDEKVGALERENTPALRDALDLILKGEQECSNTKSTAPKQ